MALAARTVFCRLPPVGQRADQPLIERLKALESSTMADASSNRKVVLQPRLTTLRSFGGDRGTVIKVNSETDEVSRFFETLSDYIESSKKSQDFEIIFGRLAMIAFAATVSVEIATGNSVFKKIDLQGLEEGALACFTAILGAAVFAYFSSNRNKVGRIFTLGCNTFIDSLIDQIVDGVFYETDISDWSDEI